MEEDVRLVSLGGILHDIGKLDYRARPGAGTHSERGAALLAQCWPQESDARARVLECIRRHHADDLRAVQEPSSLAYIVYEADNIAAGADRRKCEGAAHGFDSTAPLESVFVRLNGEGEKRVYHLRGLGASDSINYPADPATAVAPPHQYISLLDTLTANLQRTDFASCTVNEVLKYAEAVMSYVPSSTDKSEAGDISLYDHSRVTAALAAAMYQYFAAHGISDYRAWCCGAHNAALRERKAFLVVAADISGIQKFIYTIPSAGALKSLRGRSFYLAILLEQVADELLAAAGLSRANLLYNGGGHFYILAANTPAMCELLPRSMEKINNWLLRHFGTSLYLQVAWRPASAHDLMNSPNAKGERENRYGEILNALSAQLAAGKMRRYTPAVLADLFAPHSDLNRVRDAARECAVCHTSSTALRPSWADGSAAVCPQCESLYLFGERLLQQNAVLAVETGEAPGLALPSLHDEPCALTMADVPAVTAAAKQGLVKRLYVKNAMETGGLLATHLWVGDYAVRQKDRTVMDFHHMAAASDGIKRLAVLRADVDNLGAAFIAGFAQPQAAAALRYHYVTISRYAALSHQLSLFFQSHINLFCAAAARGEDGQDFVPYDIWGRPRDKRYVAIVYAGGDDMFVVGAWDDIIGLAVDLRRGFQRFACGKLTFSAGVAFFPPAYPVASMADITGELEDAAKGQPGKDSIALFGLDKTVMAEDQLAAAGTRAAQCDQGCCDKEDQPRCRHVYPWDTFIGQVLGEKLAFLRRTLAPGDDNAAVGATGRLRVGKGLLYKLLNLVDVDENIWDKMNLARLAYTLARLEPPAGDAGATQDYQAFRRQIYQWFTRDDERRQLATALHLLIYGLRQQDEH